MCHPGIIPRGTATSSTWAAFTPYAWFKPTALSSKTLSSPAFHVPINDAPWWGDGIAQPLSCVLSLFVLLCIRRGTSAVCTGASWAALCQSVVIITSHLQLLDPRCQQPFALKLPKNVYFPVRGVFERLASLKVQNTTPRDWFSLTVNT